MNSLLCCTCLSALVISCCENFLITVKLRLSGVFPFPKVCYPLSGPRISELNAEYAMLLERKKSSYAEYRRTKSEMQDWLVAQKIVQEILKEDEQKKEQLHEQEVRQEEENRQSSR